MQEVYSNNHWQGWGKDTNAMCPSTQVASTDELVCEASYPDAVDPLNMSWTGVVCTPAGTVLCLSLLGFGLNGNVAILDLLGPMNDITSLDLTSNHLTGITLTPALSFPYIPCTSFLSMLAK